MNLLLRIPESLPEEKRFDIMMLALILLINLVDCEENRQLLIKLKAPPAIDDMFSSELMILLMFFDFTYLWFSFVPSTAGESGLEALIDLFYQQEELARAEEQKTDAILDGKKDSEQTETVSTTTKSQEEFIEETVTKCLCQITCFFFIELTKREFVLFDFLLFFLIQYYKKLDVIWNTH